MGISDILGSGPSIASAVNSAAQKTQRAGLRTLSKASKKVSKNLNPTTFSAGGLTSGFDQETGSISLTSSPERAGLVSSIASRFGEQSALVAGLRARTRVQGLRGVGTRRGLQMTACSWPSSVAELPTICPRLFTPLGTG